MLLGLVRGRLAPGDRNAQSWVARRASEQKREMASTDPEMGGTDHIGE
jgi:hypothetical protein